MGYTRRVQPKEFQRRALDQFDRFLSALADSRQRVEELAHRVRELGETAAELGVTVPDAAQIAWKKLLEAGELPPNAKAYSPRLDGMGRSVPNVTFKVPTGGGKTFLGAASAAKLAAVPLGSSCKFVLWVVPSESIYEQTKKRLSDREDPYRQLLDMASQGRTRIIDKETPLDARDLQGQLTVMLLMLPSAARQSRETLRLFRDRGSVNGFFPPEDDLAAQQALREEVPNLSCVPQGELPYGGDAEATGVIRSSLGNALCMIRPILILDEMHRATSELSYRTLYGFNPCFVLEMSATPAAREGMTVNTLVNITGEDLDREEMIKLPIDLTVKGSPDWQDCLRDAWEKTEALQAEAEKLAAESSRYIRPILLIQVDRTGRDQLDGEYIHAEDAKAYLLSLGVPESAIAIKSAERNDLKDPERQNLLSPTNPIRVIITKNALQEGWDCPFAYVLCSLTASRSPRSMTQLVGRVLRQPETIKTGVKNLDRCFVFCHHAETAKVVAAIKDALEGDGMGDLVGRVVSGETKSREREIRNRRENFAGTKFYLPKVLTVEDGKTREFDWDTDLWPAVSFDSIAADAWATGLRPGEVRLFRDAHQEVDLTVLQGGRRNYDRDEQASDGRQSLEYGVRVLRTVVPNPWQAARIVNSFVSGLRSEAWSDSQIAADYGILLTYLRTKLDEYLMAEGRRVFEEGLEAGRFRFNLVAQPWWEVPESEPIETTGRQAVRYERNLLDPIMTGELNGFELEVAGYVDRHEAISWWYRNATSERSYGLAGWRRGRVYPDFILARVSDDKDHFWVLETKGGHLAANPDTVYKRDLMDVLTRANSLNPEGALGQLTILQKDLSLTCALVSQTNWAVELNQLLNR